MPVVLSVHKQHTMAVQFELISQLAANSMQPQHAASPAGVV